jgi:hypothetical protein
MANADQRSAAEIEREIEEERNALTRTLDEIHDRLSFEGLTGEFVARVRENSGDIGRTVVRGVRDNPIPIALTALGLAWLAASRRASSRDEGPDDWTSSRSPVARYGADLRDPEAVVDPAPLYDASGRPLSGDESRWDRAVGEAAGQAEELAEEANGHLSRAAQSVRRGAQGAYASAAELRRRITHGTEEMTGQARKRVIAARTRAYEAQLRAEKYAVRGREKATDLYSEQPLVAGALALAFGAAIGGLLPRTRRENEALGTYRDRVLGEAERIYGEERAKLEVAARDAGRRMQNVARDVASDVQGDLKKGAQQASEIARAKHSDAGAGLAGDDTAESGGTDDGAPKLRQV